MQKLTLLILFFLFSAIGYSQSFSEIIKVVAEDRDVQDRFGWSVDISGDFAIVGAYADDYSDLDPNMGSAYIFEKTGVSDWNFVQKIHNSDQDDYDRFGWSVAIDGDYAVIGAYAEDHNIFDGAEMSNSGSAYIFERNVSGVWVEVQKIVASDRAIGDEFGFSVDISGNTILVGSHFDSENAVGAGTIYHAGSAYIFDRMMDGTWNQTQKIVGSGRAPDLDYPTGGAPGEDPSDQFGCAVGINGDRLIVGAYHHDYDAAGGSPIRQTGTAYIFERSGGLWTEVVKLQNGDRALEDRFGWSVDISGDYAIVSAYTEDENEAGGSTLANAGSAYIFKRSVGGVWTQVKKIVPNDRSTGDRFGYDVSIDGEITVVGSLRSNTDELDGSPLSDAGAAYTFYLNTDSDTWLPLNKIDASDRKTDDQLGVSVAISGVNIIVGAYQQNFDVAGVIDIDDAGAAYIYNQYECSPTSSSQTLTLCAGQSIEVGPYTHTETGIYNDLIYSVEGCDSTVTTDLTILPAPSTSQSVSICHGYAYEIGDAEHSLPGEYTDTISTVTGCDSIVHTTLIVTPENSVTQAITICWGETYTIGASTYSSAGIYTDVITSWALCDCTITTILDVQLPVDKSISQSYNLLSAGSDDASYQWIKCHPYALIPGATDQTYLAPEIGQYAVIVTEGACSDTSSCVYVDLLSVTDPDLSPPINIYPNPNSGHFIVENQQFVEKRYTLRLINSLGELIAVYQPITSIYSIDLDNLSSGIYVLTMTTEDSFESIRVIVQ